MEDRVTELASAPQTVRPAGGSGTSRLTRALRSAAVLCVLALLAVLASVGLSPTAASAATTGCTVDVVAHPDDDLFFLNPAVVKDIKAGKCVSTVYVTSGDAGRGTTYSRTRENGVRAAYAKMAGVSNLWLTTTTTVNGKSVTRSTLLLNLKI